MLHNQLKYKKQYKGLKGQDVFKVLRKTDLQFHDSWTNSFLFSRFCDTVESFSTAGKWADSTSADLQVAIIFIIDQPD